MLIKTYGGALQGIDAITVTIEVCKTRQAMFTLVGLPDAAIKESHERIRAAVSNVGLDFPRAGIVVNLAPADVKKEEYAPDSEGVTIDQSGESIAVSGADFRFTVSKETGIIENYTYKNQLLLEQGPVPNYWRALMGNDTRYDGSW